MKRSITTGWLTIMLAGSIAALSLGACALPEGYNPPVPTGRQEQAVWICDKRPPAEVTAKAACVVEVDSETHHWQLRKGPLSNGVSVATASYLYECGAGDPFGPCLVLEFNTRGGRTGFVTIYYTPDNTPFGAAATSKVAR